MSALSSDPITKEGGREGGKEMCRCSMGSFSGVHGGPLSLVSGFTHVGAPGRQGCLSSALLPVADGVTQSFS
jgi:hypothetical protein